MKNIPPYSNYEEVGKAEEIQAPAATTTLSGGTIRVPVLRGVTRNLNPAEIRLVSDAESLNPLFEPLTRVGEGAQIVPWLAAQIEAEQGGRRYRIRLRDGVRFHDGRRLTARDVRYTFERILANAHSEFRMLLTQIHGGRALVEGKTRELEGFHIRSSLEFTVDLEEPCSFFPALLSHSGMSILPEGVNLSAGSWKDGVTGTGPFRLTAYESGQRMELERNPGYWREGYPRSERLVFESVDNEEISYSGFMKGAYSLLDHASTQAYDELRRHPVYAAGYRECPVLSTNMLALNAKTGPLQDPGLRAALFQSVRVDEVVRGVPGASQVVAGTLIPPGLLGHDPNPVGTPTVPRRSEDRVTPIELTFAHSLSAQLHITVSRLKEMTERAGFRLKSVVSGGTDFVTLIDEGKVDVGLVGWNLDYPDSHAMIHGTLDSEGGVLRNLSGSKDLDPLIEQARVEENPGVRARIYRKIEEKLAQDAFVLPLAYPQMYCFFRPEIEGAGVYMISPGIHYEDLRVGG